MKDFTISRKQAGVIYRNVKQGTVEMSKKAVSAMYDLAGRTFESWERGTDLYDAEQELVGMLLNAVDAIFAGRIEDAQSNIDAFAAAC